MVIDTELIEGAPCCRRHPTVRASHTIIMAREPGAHDTNVIRNGQAHQYQQINVTLGRMEEAS